MAEVVERPSGRSRGGGGAAARRAARTGGGIVAMPHITRRIPTYDLLDPEALDTIERHADRVLAEIGIEFHDDPEALAMWRDAGADVDGVRVRFPRGLCRSLMATIPPVFTQHARNPERSVQIGGDATVFAPVYGPPFVRDLDGERRYATIEDFRNFVRLAYTAPAIHHSGGTLCEPVDVAVNERHLDMLHAHVTLSDLPFMGSVTAPERAQDSIAVARLVFGDAFVDEHCVLVSLININSPLVMDATMTGALKVYARANQATIVSPFIVGGAMSPVTVAGTLVQVLAEAQVALAFSQLCRPGAPVIFGTFATSISMQTGAPAFGTPEPAEVLYGAAQFARRWNVPFRSGGSFTGSKVCDAQAAYDSANSLAPAVLGGVNFVLHAAGWLEGGLVSSYEKFVMDADQCAAQQKLAAGVDVSDDALALDAIAEVGPGGHYLGCAHTQANFQTAFFRTGVGDNNSFEQWQVEGQKTAAERANETARRWLADYRPPPLDEAVREAVEDFVARRKAGKPEAVAEARGSKAPRAPEAGARAAAAGMLHDALWKAPVRGDED